jgi:hypothetical protein
LPAARISDADLSTMSKTDRARVLGIAAKHNKGDT